MIENRDGPLMTVRKYLKYYLFLTIIQILPYFFIPTNKSISPLPSFSIYSHNRPFLQRFPILSCTVTLTSNINNRQSNPVTIINNPFLPSYLHSSACPPFPTSNTRPPSVSTGSKVSLSSSRHSLLQIN